VYTHWGVEYSPATDSEKKLAHEFIDAGAEIVIGSHPHVVQEHEVYKGKNIYYSLGNLIFDQYFSDAVDHGLTLQVPIAGSLIPAGVLEAKLPGSSVPVYFIAERHRFGDRPFFYGYGATAKSQVMSLRITGDVGSWTLTGGTFIFNAVGFLLGT